MFHSIAKLVGPVVLAAAFIHQAHATPISPSERADLAPSGTLRIGINTGNVLLTGKDPATGQPRGIAFDLAHELARQVGLPVKIVTFDSAGKLAEAAKSGAWDVAFLGREPERAEVIEFSAPYAEIIATYLVRADSPIRRIQDIDRDGVRIAISAKSAYDLVLSRQLKHAKLARVDGQPGVAGIEGAYRLFIDDKLDALAALKPVLIDYAARTPGARILDGRISTVYQAIGTPKGRRAGQLFLTRFVNEAKANGLVAKAIAQNGVQGVAIATEQP